MEIIGILCGRKTTVSRGGKRKTKTKQKPLSLLSKLLKTNIWEGNIKYTGPVQSPDSHKSLCV